MPSTYTASLQLEKQAYGENSETWGLRDDVTYDKIDLSISGWTVVSLAGKTSPLTLSYTQGATDQASSAALEFTGTTSGSFTVVVPGIKKLWFVKNSTTNPVIVSMSPAGGSTVTYQVNVGKLQAVWSDGVTLFDHINAIQGSLSLTGVLTATGGATLGIPLPLASGGTAGVSQNTASINTTRVGQMTIWPVPAAIPTGWLVCDGSAISRTAFSPLFAEISTRFGAGNGSTTFNLPLMAIPTTTNAIALRWVIKF